MAIAGASATIFAIDAEETEETKKTKETKETKETEETKKTKETKETKETEETEETKETKETEETKETKETEETKEKKKKVFPIGTPDLKELEKWASEVREHKSTRVNNQIGKTLGKLDTQMSKLQKKVAERHVTDGLKRDIVDTGIKELHGLINTHCSILRQYGANPQHACNIVPPVTRTVAQYNKKKYVEQGKYDPLFGTFDEEGTPEDQNNTIVLHESIRGCCKMLKTDLFQRLLDMLKHSVLAPMNSAWIVTGSKNPSKKQHGGRIPFIYKSDLLEVQLPCMCTVMRSPSAKSDYSGLQCGKMMNALDSALMLVLTVEQKREYTMAVNHKKGELFRHKYGVKAVNMCPCCSEMQIDDAYVSASTQQRPYMGSNKIFCTNMNCRKDWCKMCGVTPYHTNKDCPGPTPKNMDEMLSLFDTEEQKENMRKMTKACIGCFEGVQKEENTCNKVTCAKCKMLFCFGCLSPLDPHAGRNYVHKCLGSPEGKMHNGGRYWQDPDDADRFQIPAFDHTDKKTLDASIPPPPKPYQHPVSCNGIPAQKHVFRNGRNNPYSHCA